MAAEQEKRVIHRLVLLSGIELQIHARRASSGTALMLMQMPDTNANG
jgi:hypothetical protein